MNTNQQFDGAIVRARRPVELYREDRITDAAVISGVADVATPDNIDELVGLLPPELRTELRDWARALPI
jgi:hypothetical protein